MNFPADYDNYDDGEDPVTVLPDVEQTEEWQELLANVDDNDRVWEEIESGEGWPPPTAFIQTDSEDCYDEESFP